MLFRSQLLFAPTTVRALYIHGERDGCVGRDMCRGVERGYAGPTPPVVRTLDGGHFVHQENVAGFNRLLMSFLLEPIESLW